MRGDLVTDASGVRVLINTARVLSDPCFVQFTRNVLTAQNIKTLK